VAVFSSGANAVNWARTLMSSMKLAEEPHPVEALLPGSGAGAPEETILGPVGHPSSLRLQKETSK
jgi:hypothetical protein